MTNVQTAEFRARNPWTVEIHGGYEVQFCKDVEAAVKYALQFSQQVFVRLVAPNGARLTVEAAVLLL